VFDVFLVVLFGAIGFLMERVKIPLAPMILGLVLGPMIEDNLRIGLIKSDGSLIPFFTRPISAGFAITLMLVFLYEPLSLLIRKVLGRNSKA